MQKFEFMNDDEILVKPLTKIDYLPENLQKFDAVNGNELYESVIDLSSVDLSTQRRFFINGENKTDINSYPRQLLSNDVYRNEIKYHNIQTISIDNLLFSDGCVTDCTFSDKSVLYSVNFTMSSEMSMKAIRQYSSRKLLLPEINRLIGVENFLFVKLLQAQQPLVYFVDYPVKLAISRLIDELEDHKLEAYRLLCNVPTYIDIGHKCGNFDLTRIKIIKELNNGEIYIVPQTNYLGAFYNEICFESDYKESEYSFNVNFVDRFIMHMYCDSIYYRANIVKCLVSDVQFI